MLGYRKSLYGWHSYQPLLWGHFAEPERGKVTVHTANDWWNHLSEAGISFYNGNDTEYKVSQVKWKKMLNFK